MGATTRRVVEATPAQVWQVLADGWLYPLFVVGASRMRDVDAGWPEVGSRLHHSVGQWPLLLDDVTRVEECRPERLLRLTAKAWPLAGSAGITLRLEERGAQTLVAIEEDASAGPGRLVPAPLRQPPIQWRNAETLRRLAYVVEGRVARPD